REVGCMSISASYKPPPRGNSASVFILPSFTYFMNADAIPDSSFILTLKTLFPSLKSFVKISIFGGLLSFGAACKSFDCGPTTDDGGGTGTNCANAIPPLPNLEMERMNKTVKSSASLREFISTVLFKMYYN